MTRRRSPVPWSLGRLLEADRNALTVYGSLRWLSGSSRRLCCTRGRIKNVCNLHKDTITKAMKALNESRWVIVNYGRERNRIWYRLSFPTTDFFSVAEKSGPRAKIRRR